jgi:hypothetical protein
MTRVFSKLGGKSIVALAAGCVALAAPAFGEDLKFLATWSGAGMGNSATASALITIDDTVLLNPGQNDTSSNPFVVDFRMNVSGAASGNGSFNLSDFGYIILHTGPGNPGDLALDFTQELVGQPTGADPWGDTGAGGGDFNVFDASPGAPEGIWFFTVCTDEGSGDCMELTSFKPIHTAWLKLKVQSKGMEFSGTTLVGKAKAKGDCYWFLQWEGTNPAGGSYYCETTPGTWVGSGGASAISWNDKEQLLAGSCGLVSATGSLSGAGFFRWKWKAEADGSLKSAKVRTVSGYLTGAMGSNSFFGDCKLGGSSVSEDKVPPEVVALTP